MYVCIYTYIYVCMYVCIYVYIGLLLYTRDAFRCHIALDLICRDLVL